MSIDVHPTTEPATEFGDEAELEALYRDLAAVDLRPLWTITEQLLTPTPRPKAMPWLWSAATMKPLARRAIQLVPVERGGERRVLSPAEPGPGRHALRGGHAVGRAAVPRPAGGRAGAPAHAGRDPVRARGRGRLDDGRRRRLRHAPRRPGAHAVDGTGTTTSTAATAEMFWFDGLDLPMVEALDGVFFEEYPGPGEDQPEPAEHNVSERTHAGGTRYVGGVGDRRARRRGTRKLMNYRWADTAAELDRLAAASDDAADRGGVRRPGDRGVACCRRWRCAVHRVRAGRRSAPVRRAGNAIYVAYQGPGRA